MNSSIPKIRGNLFSLTSEHTKSHVMSSPKQRITLTSFIFQVKITKTTFWSTARMHIKFPGMRLHSSACQAVKSPVLNSPCFYTGFLHTHSNLTWSSLNPLPFITHCDHGGKMILLGLEAAHLPS